MRKKFPALLAALPAMVALLLGAARNDMVELAGRVYTADGGNAGEIRVVVRSGEHADSALVDARGRFALRVPASARGEEVELLAEPAGLAQGLYHPSLGRVRVDPEGGEHGIVLVPRRWRIPAGSFAGQEVEISIRRAFESVCSVYCSSFFRGRESSQGPRVPSWPAASLPLRLAFERSAPSDATPRDSAAFWRIVEQMEEEFGGDLFRPATLEETAPVDGGPEDVVLVIFDRSLRSVGWGSSVSQLGDILYGAVRVRDGRVFSTPVGRRLVKHELMHALGVGHTCSWSSAVSDVRVCPGRTSSSLTANDVGYLQLLHEVRDLQRAVGAGFGLEAALAGERARVR